MPAKTADMLKQILNGIAVGSVTMNTYVHFLAVIIYISSKLMPEVKPLDKDLSGGF